MGYAPSGEQFELRAGDHHATVVEVGGGIRAYRVGERDVLHSYPLDAMCDGAHGAPLVPWPNRLADGRYRFDGTDYQVALTEPEKNNALHGFVRWRNWQAARHSEARVTMSTRLHPLQGYPFALDLRIDYALGEDGLAVTMTATNIGDTACPYASGQHPYLSAGNGLIDACTLRIDGRTRVISDPVRQLPSGIEAVAGTDFDFRSPRRLGDQPIDFAFGDLVRDESGRAWVHLAGTDGHTASCWVDGTYRYIEIYTADTLTPDRRRRGLGTEPMTCPPNGLQTGEHVIRLEPGESTTTTWGATLTRT